MVHELVSPERAATLTAFAAEFVALCEKYNLNVYASPDADMIELQERSFTYPEGYDFSATMTGAIDGKLEAFSIDREWDDEE